MHCEYLSVCSIVERRLDSRKLLTLLPDGPLPAASAASAARAKLLNRREPVHVPGVLVVRRDTCPCPCPCPNDRDRDKGGTKAVVHTKYASSSSSSCCCTRRSTMLPIWITTRVTTRVRVRARARASARARGQGEG